MLAVCLGAVMENHLTLICKKLGVKENSKNFYIFTSKYECEQRNIDGITLAADMFQLHECGYIVWQMVLV